MIIQQYSKSGVFRKLLFFPLNEISTDKFSKIWTIMNITYDFELPVFKLIVHEGSRRWRIFIKTSYSKLLTVIIEFKTIFFLNYS